MPRRDGAAQKNTVLRESAQAEMRKRDIFMRTENMSVACVTLPSWDRCFMRVSSTRRKRHNYEIISSLCREAIFPS